MHLYAADIHLWPPPDSFKSINNEDAVRAFVVHLRELPITQKMDEVCPYFRVVIPKFKRAEVDFARRLFWVERYYNTLMLRINSSSARPPTTDIVAAFCS